MMWFGFALGLAVFAALAMARRMALLTSAHKVFPPSARSGRADHTAGDLCPRVPRRLGVEIIRAAVDHNRAAYHIPHLKAAGPHRQKRPAPAQQQRRQIARMLRVGQLSRVVVSLGMGKSLAAAVSTFVDMQGKKARVVFPGQSGYVSHHQNTSPLLVKSDLAGQRWRVGTAPHMGHSVRTGKATTHFDHLALSLCAGRGGG